MLQIARFMAVCAVSWLSAPPIHPALPAGSEPFPVFAFSAALCGRRPGVR